MMVIRGSLATAFQGIPATQVHNFPADRCVWSQSYVGTENAYRITGARFFGHGGGATNPPAAAVIQNAELGYIGKSGRFVPITD